MKIIQQHIPTFISGYDPKINTFETLAELLNKEWVKSWSLNEFEGLPFWRYSESLCGDKVLLIAEWKKGSAHKKWVIGYMSDSIGLPGYETL